jgi:hypothetical protein
MVMLSARWPVCGGVPLSVTRTVKDAVPPALGVPLIVGPLKVSPAGKDPETIDQL